MKISECQSLEEVRSNIDRIDELIIGLISERSSYVNQAARFKKTDQEVEAPKRVENVISKVRSLALAKNLNPDIADKVYRTMIDSFIAQEKDQLKMSEKFSDFEAPANHIKFLAKTLFGKSGNIINGSIAYLQPGGGGPLEQHTHQHSHLFIIVDGIANIKMKDEVTTVKANNYFLVDGNISHSVWNATNSECVIIGISVLS